LSGEIAVGAPGLRPGEGLVMGHETSTIDVDGRMIAYERAGSGPPLVLLHGGLSDHREWRGQIDGLADAYTVIAWDTPGAGGSADMPPTARMPDFADALAGFIHALGIDRPHVLGLSWGSTLALELFNRHRDLPRSLVLTAAYAGWAGSLSPEVVRQRLETSLRDIEQMSPEAFVRTWVPSLFTAGTREGTIEWYVGVMADFHPTGVAPMLHAIAEADLRPVLPTIDVPTLLLYGELDQRSPLEVADAMHTAIPASELKVLPGVGHMSNLEAPAAFNAAVRDFLERAAT
jgi:pimeloyl-ACP methyl ester carboxylesterase